jgi:hypothetical protein
VALEGDLICGVVPDPQLRDEAVVAGERQQATRAKRPHDGAGLERYRAHVGGVLVSLSAQKVGLTLS